MNALARTLRLFVNVKKDEIHPALLFFFFWFFIIVVFQVLKPLKSGIFVHYFGAHMELYAKLANIAVAVFAVICFTALYNRLGSRRLVATLCGFFILTLLGFVGILGGGRPAPIAIWLFYLLGDLWTTVWVTTFWAYLNEMTETEQSKRLYGLIGGGGVVGGVIGPLMVWQFVKPLGSPILLTGCAAITGLIGLLIWWIEALATRPDAPIGRRESAQLHVADEGKKMNAAIEGAKLVAASKYLLAVVMIVFLYELVSQILDFQYKTTAQEHIPDLQALQAFFGQVGTIIGVVSVVAQFFLVSFIIRKFGMVTALLVLPLAMAAASGIYLAVPVLWTGALLSISDNSLAYSINQTARETLFMPTSADVKYKARAFANMFVQRFGKGIAILMALVLTIVDIRLLSLLAFCVMAIWSGFALHAGRSFDALTGKDREEGLVQPQEA